MTISMGVIENACDSAHFECCQHKLNSAVFGSIHLAMETKAAILSVPLFPWIVSFGQRLLLFSKHLRNTNNNNAMQLPPELHSGCCRIYSGLFQ